MVENQLQQLKKRLAKDPILLEKYTGAHGRHTTEGIRKTIAAAYE